MDFTNCQVYIDPSSNIIYSSFYIKGLYDVFGKENIRFSANYFEGLNKGEDLYSFDSYIAFVIVENGKKYKVIVDFGDDYPIRTNAYKWCDVYAKINIDAMRTTDEYKAKLLSITPSFSIRIWNLFEVIFFSLSNLIKVKFRPQISLQKHFRYYLSQLKVLWLDQYSNKDESVSNYVFFISSLWAHPNCLTGTNLYRKMFMEHCFKNKINFEGGFLVTDDEHPQFNEFKDLTFTKRYSLSKYIENIKKSILVFNTPAVHNCHGWKLGQFLAMNKAIISTRFHNSLPKDLEHGKNIHFINDESELDDAVQKILHDDVYRKKLENGAKEYYVKYASPNSVINQVCNRIKKGGNE